LRLVTQSVLTIVPQQLEQAAVATPLWSAFATPAKALRFYHPLRGRVNVPARWRALRFRAGKRLPSLNAARN
jgi:hypothetical protein